MRKRIAIVEDDVFIAEDLNQMLIDLNYDVIHVSNSANEAIKHFKEKIPDLALMDIELDDTIDGIHLAGILKLEYNVPVIFTTAFTDQQTLERVKKISPFGYVVKPYMEANIKVALELALSRVNDKEEATKKEEDESYFVNSVNGIVKINPAEILYISAFDYYANIFTVNGKVLAKTTLKEVLNLLNKPDLLRVHKSYVVNINKITRIKDNAIHMEDVKVPIGRSYKEELKARLKII